MKKPREKDKFDEGVLRRNDLIVLEEEIDEVFFDFDFSME